jgi:hypothetical protein
MLFARGEWHFSSEGRMSDEFEDREEIAGRPAVVNWLWGYCAFMIFVGVCCLVGGILVAANSDWIDGGDDPETWLIVGCILAFAGVAAGLMHAVPFFLRRNEASWKLIHGLLIASLIVWALFFTLFIVPSVILLTFWGKQEVKDYYGIEDKHRRRRRRDDGWDKNWDRPRR